MHFFISQTTNYGKFSKVSILKYTSVGIYHYIISLDTTAISKAKGSLVRKTLTPRKTANTFQNVTNCVFIVKQPSYLTESSRKATAPFNSHVF